MRGKKTIINTIFSLLEEMVAIISSLIIPRLILSNFGSVYNGLTTSITQFLYCAVLLRAGIGGATRAALYKPLANNDKDKVDSIVKATNIFMKKVGIILATSILIFASIYPFFVKNEFDWFFTFSLFVIIGISTFAESFFGITYLIVLQADQRLYVSSIFKILSYFSNLVLSVILINSINSIHIAKLGSTVAFCIYPIALNIYVNKRYKINKNVAPDYNSISQRWNAFWHQVASFVNNNTDVIVLTIFANMLEVSVYSVYSLVVSGLNRFINSFTNGIEAAFGNMIAKNECDKLNENLSVIELIMFSISTMIYTSSIILILPFVRIYTKGILDVDYIRPAFAYILLISQFFFAIRLPYQYVIQAAGHFKETKKYAIIEAVLNVLVSVILVIKYGLIGVAIGTFVALFYKTIMFSNYVSDKIVSRRKIVTYKKCVVSFIEFVMIYFIIKKIKLTFESNYINWVLNSLVVIIISLIVIFFGIILFYKNDFIIMINKLRNIRSKKKKCVVLKSEK